MNVDAAASSSTLRLIQPPASVRTAQSATPVKSADPAAPVSGGDPYKFESIYQASLPKPAIGHALERLDRIRAQLVAARTSVPIHFDAAQPAAAMRSSALARAYLRAGPSPADAHISATNAAAQRLDETA
jgi:hypothetical protein